MLPRAWYWIMQGVLYVAAWGALILAGGPKALMVDLDEDRGPDEEDR